MNAIIRPLTPVDASFLKEMLYHAIYIPAGTPLPKPDVVNLPELEIYARDWGRADDLGFVAMDAATGECIGAAWLRLLTGETRGFGYVDHTTPELAIAVLPAYRRRGIGTRLLTQLFETASERFSAVSLSVDAANPAYRLYRRLGFETIETRGDSLTMKRTLKVSPCR